jgi:hypothetical protein
MVAGDAGVVAGGDLCGADAGGHVDEGIELDEVVAEGAGDGGAAVEVVVDEGADDGLFKGVLKVDDVVGDADQLGDVAGVVDIVDGTAAAGGFCPRRVQGGGAGSRAAW